LVTEIFFTFTTTRTQALIAHYTVKFGVLSLVLIRPMRVAHTYSILKQKWRKEESCLIPSLQCIFMEQCISKHNDNFTFNLHITIVRVSEPVYSKKLIVHAASAADGQEPKLRNR